MLSHLFILSTLTASLVQGLAIYAAYPYGYAAQGSSLVTPTQQQYLAQDEFGQYAYGYAEPLSSKQETRSLDGTTRGSYSYRDATGKLQTVDYTADSEGFHVAATNLPTAASPRSSIASSSQHIQNDEEKELPQPVADTAEVAAAKSIHLKRLEAEKQRNDILARRSNVIAVPAAVHYTIPRYYIPRFYY